MQIFIPTRGRVFQETYASLPQELRNRVTFVTPYGEGHVMGIVGVWHTPPEINGIGPTRQWIIDNATDDKIVMLDDDLVFATRRDDYKTKFRPSTPDDINHLFSSISAYLDQFAHVGVSTREGGNRDTSDFVYNTRLLRILAYRVDVLRREEIRFDRLELMEDFFVTLSLLSKGYPNVRINSIVHNQRSSNAPGGCSTYRTLEKQREAAFGLKAAFPDFVSIVEKTTKTAWQGKTRTDVVIQWKKAFNATAEKSALDLSSLNSGHKASALSAQEQSTKDTQDSAE